MYDVASPYFPLNFLPNCHSANNSYTMYYMFHAMWEFTQSENPQIAYAIWGFSDCVAQWSAVVDLDYYTEQADHDSSSSGQLAIARIYSGGSNCEL